MRHIGLCIGLLAGSANAGEPHLQMRELQWEVRSAELASGMRVVLQQDRSKPLVAIAVGWSGDAPRYCPFSCSSWVSRADSA